MTRAWPSSPRSRSPRGRRRPRRRAGTAEAARHPARWPPLDRSLWGVVLIGLEGKLLYGRNADRMFIPASNTKLVVATVAAALFHPP